MDRHIFIKESFAKIHHSRVRLILMPGIGQWVDSLPGIGEDFEWSDPGLFGGDREPAEFSVHPSLEYIALTSVFTDPQS